MAETERSGGWLETKSRALAFAAAIGLLGTTAVACGESTPVALPPVGSQPSGTADARIGFDVSYPQCGQGFPPEHSFAIVGLNGKLANLDNPCRAQELAWAEISSGASSLPKTAVYVNTANPGNVVGHWPRQGKNAYGACDGGNTPACSFEYGEDLAEADLGRLPDGMSPKPPVWLDVETVFSWQPVTADNVAALEGMVMVFRQHGMRVGVYSSAGQWRQIAGTVPAGSSLRGLDEWVLGAHTPAEAKSNCAQASFMAGKVVVAQFTTDTLDGDYACSES